MTLFWHWFIVILVTINVIGAAWLLIAMRRLPKNDVKSGEKRPHTFDGIEEYNNPLPRWWMWLFGITIIFTLIYLFLYPGLGNFLGYLGWSQQQQWSTESQAATQQYAPLFASLGKTPIPALVQDPHAIQVAERLFINNCATCHGPNGQGAKGFPNLTDNQWLFGGNPEDIETSIAKGRQGIMPPMVGAIGGETQVPLVANYVLKISGQSYDATQAAQGETIFQSICAACHGPEGHGNPLLGAPNLTTGHWLFGGTLVDIEETIRYGRQGQMPAHEQRLGSDKVHLLAAYVYYLSHQP